MNTVRRYLLGMSIGLVGLIGIAACHKGVSAAQQEPQQQPGYDPSDQNMAPVDSSGQPINESQQQAGQNSAGGAPIERRTPEGDQYQAPPPDQSQQAPPPDQGNYTPEDLYGDQDVSGEPPVYADQPPPELPVYEQPAAPGPNYMWTPGYWDYAPIGYYWVPGVWVAAPYPGALWTPCYWGFYGGRYRFHHGYWGLHIGFYGGINYGFGYYGTGYRGGYWNGNNFYYNTAVSHISPRISTVYVHNYTIPHVGNRVSYNGGRGGLQVQPHPAEVAAMRGPRIPPMSTQRMVQRDAAQNRQQFYSQNQGRPHSATSALPVSADKGIQRPNPAQPANGNGYRPGYQRGGQNRPGQPAYQVYPPQSGNASRPGAQPGRQEVPPVNGTHVQPARPVPQQPYRPNAEPAARPAPEAQQPLYRPNPQSQQQVRPNTQYRPETQQPRPMEQPRPAPEYRSPPPAPRPAAPAAPPQMHTAPPPQQPHPAPTHTEPQHPH
jgi:hypothetical protein